MSILTSVNTNGMSFPWNSHFIANSYFLAWEVISLHHCQDQEGSLSVTNNFPSLPVIFVKGE